RQRGLKEASAVAGQDDAPVLGSGYLDQLLEDGVRAGQAAATVKALEAARGLFVTAQKASQTGANEAMIAGLDHALVFRAAELAFVDAVDADAAVLVPGALNAANRAGAMTQLQLA